MNLEEAYSVQTPDDNRKLYADWAESYDQTFVAANYYIYPQAVAAILAELVTREFQQRVVDIGCGTGMVGLSLRNLVPTCQIDGLDISPQMLDRARKATSQDGSSTYSNLFEADLTQPLPLPNSTYQAAISAGVFTHGHLGPGALAKVIELVEAGGWCTIGINANWFEIENFGGCINDLLSNDQICNLSIREVEIYASESSHFGELAKVASFQSFLSKRVEEL